MSRYIDTEQELPRRAAGAPEAGAIRRAWRDVRQAVLGCDMDFTEGSLGRAILVLSIPMVLEMVLESVFAVVDIFFVARLGADAVATVGITESVLTLVYAVAFGFSMGTTAIVARRIGEKRPEAAAVTAVQAIAVGLLVSLPVAVLGVVFSRELLVLMGLGGAVAAANHHYAAVILGGNVVILLLFIINAVFRSAGDAAIAMRVLWLANGLNIILDPCLIFGWGPFPELGVTGAAVATTIGRGTAVVVQLWTLARRGGRIRVSKRNLRLEPAVMARLIRVSAGGISQFVISTSSWIGLMRIVSMFGSQSLAGYTIAIRIITFTILPSWGMSNAAATLVGQSLGAGKPDRAARSVWLTAYANMIFLGLVAGAFIFFPPFFVRLFTADAAVVAVGADCLRILSYGYVVYALGMVMIQAFNGAGDTVTPTVINFFSYWVLGMPLAYALAVSYGVGERGVFFAILAGDTMLAISSAILFRRGRWKTRKV